MKSLLFLIALPFLLFIQEKNIATKPINPSPCTPILDFKNETSAVLQIFFILPSGGGQGNVTIPPFTTTNIYPSYQIPYSSAGTFSFSVRSGLDGSIKIIESGTTIVYDCITTNAEDRRYVLEADSPFGCGGHKEVIFADYNQCN